MARCAQCGLRDLPQTPGNRRLADAGAEQDPVGMLVILESAGHFQMSLDHHGHVKIDPPNPPIPMWMYDLVDRAGDLLVRLLEKRASNEKGS